MPRPRPVWWDVQSLAYEVRQPRDHRDAVAPGFHHQAMTDKLTTTKGGNHGADPCGPALGRTSEIAIGCRPIGPPEAAYVTDHLM